MKVYLAARYTRRLEMARISGRLRREGVVVTSRWHDHPPIGEHQAALEDVRDLEEADTLVLFNDGEGGRGGKDAEWGMAYAWGHRLVLVGPYSHVFTQLANHTFDRKEDAIEWLTLMSNPPLARIHPVS